MLRRFLLFSAGGERFALELKDVAEVMEPRQSFPLPVAPEHFQGLINFHGTLTAVLDLPHFLGRGRVKGSGKLLVLDGKVGSLALQVDGVGSIITEEAVLAWHESEDPLYAARLLTVSGSSSLFDVEALLQRLEEGLP